MARGEQLEGPHLQPLLPLFLPLAADSLLLCSLCAAIFLHKSPRVSRPWRRRPTNSAYLWTITILSLRWISSSSSFFLLSKWTSIKVWSSIRSFSILLRWISCGEDHTLIVLLVLIKCYHSNHFVKTLCRSSRCSYVISYSRTSKSTFSPSGIFGGIKLGIINVLKIKNNKMAWDCRVKWVGYRVGRLRVWRPHLSTSMHVCTCTATSNESNFNISLFSLIISPSKSNVQVTRENMLYPRGKNKTTFP